MISKLNNSEMTSLDIPPPVIFFWLVESKEGKPFKYGYLSNWYLTPITYNKVNYNCSEQLYMAFKAQHFGDKNTYDKILQTQSPREMKKLGQNVQGFNSKEWDAVKEEYMYIACFEKFRQNPDLAKKLLATRTSLIAEASPYDKIWGIGMFGTKLAVDPEMWRGQNLLGKCLEKVRAKLWRSIFSKPLQIK